jgi:hypothetical protein
MMTRPLPWDDFNAKDPGDGRQSRYRILAAANAALGRNRFVAPIDVLTGLGWLRPEHTEAWRRGRVPYLERVTVASLRRQYA